MTSKEELIAAAQALAAKRGTIKLSMYEFRRGTGIGPRRVFRHFGNWRKFCKAAGLEATMWNVLIPDEEIFAAMHDAFLATKGVVIRSEFERHFRHSGNVLVRRFKSWPNALAEFGAWARENVPDFPYHEHIAHRIATMPKRRILPRAVEAGPPWKTIGTRPCGDAIGFRSLAHAPINELGVVLAFGMVADDLGFSVEAVAQDFPDCIAKRRIGDGRWETVRIEFEYRSRAFREHNHAPGGCDVIVCWEHDWADCPLEVLELKSAIGHLKN